ncbi:MAG: DUF1674 domain-containing protein [Pseudomonadota bacterium]
MGDVPEISEEERLRREKLPAAARRALEEADVRKAERAAELARLEAEREGEKGGPKSIEPTRYGDWERKGIAYDF